MYKARALHHTSPSSWTSGCLCCLAMDITELAAEINCMSTPSRSARRFRRVGFPLTLTSSSTTVTAGDCEVRTGIACVALVQSVIGRGVLHAEGDGGCELLLSSRQTISRSCDTGVNTDLPSAREIPVAAAEGVVAGKENGLSGILKFEDIVPFCIGPQPDSNAWNRCHVGSGTQTALEPLRGCFMECSLLISTHVSLRFLNLFEDSAPGLMFKSCAALDCATKSHARSFIFLKTYRQSFVKTNGIS